ALAIDFNDRPCRDHKARSGNVGVSDQRIFVRIDGYAVFQVQDRHKDAPPEIIAFAELDPDVVLRTQKTFNRQAQIDVLRSHRRGKDANAGESRLLAFAV